MGPLSSTGDRARVGSLGDAPLAPERRRHVLFVAPKAVVASETHSEAGSSHGHRTS